MMTDTLACYHETMLTLVAGKHRSFPRSPCTLREYWGADEEGTICAYVRFLEYEHYLMLCDVEVRVGWRGEGRGMRMLRMVEERTSKTMFATGTYTPKGQRSLAQHLPLGPGFSPRASTIKDMGFVHDWDNKISMDPL